MKCANASPAPAGAILLQLAQDLEQMRDSLVELSLLLQDFRFELDIPRRAEVNWSVAHMLHKMGSPDNGRIAR